MRWSRKLYLISALCLPFTPAQAALFETSDFSGLCKDASPVSVPAQMQGKFTDAKTNGWLEVGPSGVTRVDWQGFNYYSRTFAGRGFCIRQEFVEEKDGFMELKLTLERIEGGFFSNEEAYTLRLSLNKAAETYNVESSSAGTVTIGFIPLGGTTVIPTETMLTRKAPDAQDRVLSGNKSIEN